jgi:hypothetical protein
MAQIKAQFRDAVKEFSRSEYGCEISSLTDIQRSDALILAYIQGVFNQRNPGLFPDEIEDLRLNIVDGPSDRGADFIFKTDTQVYIFQAKYRKSENLESETEFDFFLNLIKRLCPETGGKQKLNQKVLDLISDIDWENDTFALYYISLAKKNPNIELAAERGVDGVANTALSDISDRCTLDYLSEVDLNEQYRETLRASTGQVPSVEVLLSSVSKNSDHTYLEIDQGDQRRCYIGALSAGQVQQLYQKHKGSLFNLNIRNYVGETRTNKDIAATAISEAKNFFYYNNGISAIARKIEPVIEQGKTILRCLDFSIINGAQTFRSISKAHARNKVATEKLLVPIRITEFDFVGNRSDDFLEKITKFNNTQNAVKISDFRSNDPVQTSIAHYIANMAAVGGHKFSYRNKRTQQVDRNKIFIGLDEFCRTIHAFLFGPADIFGGLSYLYDTSPRGGYTKLFGDPNEPLAEETFREYFGAWLICTYARECLKQGAAEREAALELADDDEKNLLNLQKNALERRYHVFYALGEVVREVCKIQQKDVHEFVAGYAKPKWREEPKKQELINSMLEIGIDILVQAYQLASRSGDFVHRNFFRNEEIQKLLKEAMATRRSQTKGISV